MIAHLRGNLLEKVPGRVVVEASGVGYELTVSVPTFTSIPSVGSPVAFHVHTHVREDALQLFGFLERADKQLFERLITVTGVGPKLAITILGGMSSEDLVSAIRSQDHAMLTRIPGVGKKLAERLVLELKEKLEDLASSPAKPAATKAEDDVLSALVNLGYQRPAAEKAIDLAVKKNAALAQDFDELFRAALQLIR